MKNTLLLLTFMIFVSFNASSQKFLRAFDGIATKKLTYVTMKDGSEKEGKARKLKRKKGLYKSITLKDEQGNKTEIDIEEIDFAYLPQSGLSKVFALDDFISDATQWEQGLYDKDRLKEGYAFFESIEVQVKKKKTMIMLMQLVNPGTCSRIKVYHDPIAGETAGLGIGGIQVTGGKEKSYYISKDGEVAWKLKKKDYRKIFNELFEGCEVVQNQFDKSWDGFEAALFKYNAECAK